ncbi:MAG: hypothetical protein GQ558_04740, partial [Thermoplasmata archaeon]|nr:hypothetical protein [Thermoplasmata archaeon]
MAVGVLFVSSAAAEAKTIIVDDDWDGADYSTIGEAIAAASPGDTIRVYDGTYNEANPVNKALDLVGNGTDTIIDGTGKDHTFGFSLVGGGCNVSGFQFYYWWPTHEFGAIGIYSDGNRVFDNLFYYNARGTFLDSCNENHIFNNTFLLNQYGVCVTNNANDSNVSFNIFTEPRGYGSYGILYGRSSNYTIFSNTFHNYTTSALGIHRSDNVTVSFNMFEASPLEEGRRTGSMIYECIDTDVHNNTFVKCDKAVSVGGSINTVIEHNSISYCNIGIGISLAGVDTMSIGTEVHFNNIFDNAVYGIDATTNTAAVVNATHNWWGDASGPYHPVNNSLGVGDELTDNVDFYPWLGKMFSPLPPIAFIVDLRPSLATEGDPVLFVGRGLARNYTDLQVWRSSIDGEIYRGPSFAFTRNDLSNGTHTIYLKVRDEYGIWSEEVSTTLVINGRPRARIETISPTLTNEGETVSFEGSFFDHENDVTTYRWSSDIDGFLSFKLVFSTDSLSNGTHNITFDVRDGYKVWSDEALGQVSVNGLPLARIVEIEPTFLNETDPVIFRGDFLDHENNISEYQWMSDIDGQLSDQKMFGTSSLSNGTHTITFQVMDGYGEWSEPATGTVTVNGIPIAIIVSIGPNPTAEGEFVNFRGSYIDDGDSAVSYEWESDIDGTLSFVRDFATSELMPGNHVITFRVMDRHKVWSELAMATLVVNGRPTAAIDAILPQAPTEGVPVTFRGSFSDKENDVREFLWGSDIDGTLSVHQEFSTSSLSKGVHTITFRVMDGYGAWSTNATMTVEVNGIPSAIIIGIEPSLANEGDVVRFEGGYEDFEDAVTTFEWVSDIDGPLSSDRSFDISTLSAGTHGINFRVMDDHGVWSEHAVGSVLINQYPLAAILRIAPEEVYEGDEVTFEADGSDDGMVVGYRWTSSIDGNIGSEAAFARADLSPGKHIITLKVQDDLGAWSDEVTRTLEIKRHEIELEIVEIRFETPIFEGDGIVIEVDVSNIGLISVSDILVVFYDGGEAIGDIPVGVSLEPDALSTVALDWMPSLGNHTISIHLEHD